VCVLIEKPDLPALKARAERYRELAAEVLRRKERCGSEEFHAAYVNLAAAWKSLADKIETTLERTREGQVPYLDASSVTTDETGEERAG